MSVPALPPTTGLPGANPGETEQQWLCRVFGSCGSSSYTPPIAPTNSSGGGLIGGMAQAAQAQLACQPGFCTTAEQACGLGIPGLAAAGTPGGCISYAQCIVSQWFTCNLQAIETAAGNVARITLVNILLIVLVLAGIYMALKDE